MSTLATPTKSGSLSGANAICDRIGVTQKAIGNNRRKGMATSQAMVTKGVHHGIMYSAKENLPAARRRSMLTKASWLTFAVVLFWAPVASAQPERYELGHRLRAFE